MAPPLAASANSTPPQIASTASTRLCILNNDDCREIVPAVTTPNTPAEEASGDVVPVDEEDDKEKDILDVDATTVSDASDGKLTSDADDAPLSPTTKEVVRAHEAAPQPDQAGIRPSSPVVPPAPPQMSRAPEIDVQLLLNALVAVLIAALVPLLRQLENAPQAAAPAPAPVNVLVRATRLQPKEPDTFAGDRSRYPAWKTEMRIVARGEPLDDVIPYVLSYIRGRAVEWWKLAFCCAYLVALEPGAEPQWTFVDEDEFWASLDAAFLDRCLPRRRAYYDWLQEQERKYSAPRGANNECRYHHDRYLDQL
ncbi:uncharacterized protein BXZ73DRAFT_102742 [Epithele typhae]|uniref:uncharacterized protein n=1 Tax=Epithele typhae TaxID=378194 RepID=UPI00200823A9|nr:uncharacterized protein BXZ73DRAFT_102742 [Epithele typhae]KAH9927153.1 hypothetical protein BXZ73DRAFT_102742 [Epithele typhae]